jgi:hypothetical protein
MLACEWLDVVFVPLMAAGIERIVPVAGTAAGAYGDSIIYADYTHSLAGAIVLSIVFGAMFAPRYGRRSAVVLGMVSMSHWVLDLVTHRSDMPILPGNWGDLPRLGLGLWRWHAAAASVELGFVVLGAWLYARSALQVAGTDRALGRRARLCAILCGATGIVVLGLNLAGL